MNPIIEYIPILTTIFSVYFTYEIYKHYQFRKTSYLLWWTIGVLTFGLGTLSESINVLYGWSEGNLKYWYIVGALLGGFPLAQGSIYLLMNRKFANFSAYFFVSLIVIASVLVILSPVSDPAAYNYRLTGKVFEWQKTRYFSILINNYSFIFLVGGAIFSARKYKKKSNQEAAFKGNVYIAIGGLLPGIGGTFTRFGYVEVLFVTELIGLILIYIGYRIIKTDRAKQYNQAKVAQAQSN